MWGNTITIHSVLKKKTTKLNSQPAQYKKNKIDKDNFEKKIIKKIQKNIIAIHNILIKEKNGRTKFSTSSIFKKNQQR